MTAITRKLENLNPDYLLLPVKWLLKNQVGLREYFMKTINFSNHLGHSHYGLKAQINKSGYGADGSYYHLDIITGQKESPDARFADTFSRIERSTSQFKQGNKIDWNNLATIKRVVQDLEKRDILVISYLAPVAPKVRLKMEKKSDRYVYIKMFRNELNNLTTFHFDFFDQKSTNITDCEFIDGFHHGDLAEAKMVLRMIQNPKLKETKIFNEDFLKNVVNNNENRALIDNKN